MRDVERFIPPSTPPEVLGLREGVDAPDLSDEILREVGRRRGWLSRRQRRLLGAARCAAGFMLVGVVVGVLLVQRFTPVEGVGAPEARPLAELMRNVHDDASVAVQAVSTQMRSIPEQIVNGSQRIVTGRIERHGRARVVELASPAWVVGEDSLTPLLMREEFCDLRPLVMQVGHGMAAGAEGGVLDENASISIQWHSVGPRSGVGMSWPAGARVRQELETPLFEAGELDRRRP